MTLLAFLLGLALGIGFWLWQQRRFQRKLRQMLGVLQMDSSSTSMPVLSRLRREIALANQHREELEEELLLRKQLFEVAPLGYLQVDEENQLLWCNQQARQWLQIDGWEPGQIRLLLELVRSYELDQLIEQTRHRQQPDIHEWVFHPPCLDGEAMREVRSLTLRAFSWPLPQDQVGVFLENRQPLIELSQSRNQWFSDLAHELRTPLTSIYLVAETLQERLKPPESRWIEQVLHETNRLIHLVRDWLELSNLENHPNKSLTYQSVELRSLILSAWQTLEPLAQLRQLTFAYCGPDTLRLKADEARLTQVFLNILDNSIKHSPSGEAIRVEVTQLVEDMGSETTDEDATPSQDVKSLRSPISTENPIGHLSLGVEKQSDREEPNPIGNDNPEASPSTPPDLLQPSDPLSAAATDSLSGVASNQELATVAPSGRLEPGNRSVIQIDIIDSGLGFSDSDLPHVFERLYRGDASRQKPQKLSGRLETSGGGSGSGLGLSIVQQIIQAHGGSVTAKNHPETQGAWLQIKLPNGKASS